MILLPLNIKVIMGFHKHYYTWMAQKGTVHNLTGVLKLDEWLGDIPDTPKINDYGASVGAETNSIIIQKNKRKKNEEKNVMATLNVRWPYPN